MSKQEKYDAFISYRHCLPDSEIALRLQKKLESFRLPKDVAGTAKRSRLNSVFLDETELSVSDDLSVELSSALLNSDYLIAICSPEYLKSKWCMKEVQTFLDYKGRKNILLVLADGEPENAFPEILLYEDVFSSDAYGKVIKNRVYKEPLAADCRGKTSKERKEKTDDAVIRLISAIMGIRYDNLQQRHRKEIQARTKRSRSRMRSLPRNMQILSRRLQTISCVTATGVRQSMRPDLLFPMKRPITIVSWHVKLW